MRIGNLNFVIYKNRNTYWSFPNVSYSHKYWYLWNIYLDWGDHYFNLEICKTDWNKYYKDKCKNYTDKCKHNLECNFCKECFKQ